MIDLHDKTLGPGLVPLVDLLQGAHPARGHPGRREPGQQLLPGDRREGLLEHLDHPGPVGDALTVGPHPLRLGVQAELLAQPAPQALVAAGHLDGAVRAVEQPVGRDRGVVVALRLRDLAGHGPARALEGVHPDDRGQQRGAHDLPPPGALALQEGGEHAVGAVHPGEEIADRHPHPLRVVRARSGQGHEPRLALGDLVVAGAAALGSVVAEAGDRQHDQARVELGQVVGRETEPVQGAGTEVLHEDVGAADQLGEDGPAVVGLEVEGDGLLVAVAGQEVGRNVGAVRSGNERRSPGAGLVTATGGLHLDHPCTQVGHHHGSVGSREGPGEVDDDRPGQGTVGAAGGVRRGRGGLRLCHRSLFPRGSVA